MHQQELDFIHFIHQFRNPVFDAFFKFLNFFDTQEFFFVLIPIIWLWYGWKAGLRVCYMLLLSGMINHFLKEFFGFPRPFHIDPSVGLIYVRGLGFPSGAAQTVILLSGLLILSGRATWKWMLALTYITFISFSRVYLGVHFPSDILGGYLVGFSLLAIYVYVRPPVEKQLERLKPLTLFALSQVIPLLFILGAGANIMLRTCNVMMGIGIGLFVISSYHLYLPLPKTTKEYLLRALVGVGGTFICYTLMRLLPIADPQFYIFLRFLGVGLWVSLGSSLICTYFSNCDCVKC